MRLPFIPREEKFFELFIEDGQNVLAGARMLEEFFRSYEQRERLASQLRDTERRGDTISHDIGQKLENTFVTPFDREDIHQLISRLDDVLDFIEAVADLCTDDGPDPIEVIKWKEVYTLLEDTIDACEDAANVIERIVVKHA